jgi:DNA polymerase I-like protein with 3'-5' exonuclease and polymerase domains
MDIITIDFETYYDRDFSLTKLTTEEYIRSDRFEVIGISVKVNNNGTEWASGTHEQIRQWLQESFRWSDSLVLAHNTLFDGAILNWRFGINPRAWLDTLCMGRAIHGVEVGGSLKALAERYGLGEKGTEVLNALGKGRLDFSEAELARYGDYCINDVELTYKLFSRLARKFPKQELKIIDTTLRMFIEPRLELDPTLLASHLEQIKIIKGDLLSASGVDKSDLMSSDKFAELLRGLGVTPPTKISPTTNKPTYAFSKTDQEFLALADHPDGRVQTLVAARLGNKSTLEETRTQRFIDIASRGSLPVPIRYYAAHTGRFGGDDKINLQNLPTRGTNANQLKKAIVAPKGYTIIDADSSQIEARVLAWLAGQDDLVTAFANREDVYKKMASAIYGIAESDVDKSQRFVGKTTILGAGYGMGALKFQVQLKNIQFHYKTRRGRTKIYGGKVIENVCQAIARCIIAEQMLRIVKKYKVVLTVHDAIAVCVRDVEADEAQAYVEKCMRWVPEWATGLPVDCESGAGKSYGDC